jgi:hypothetical protein
MVTRQERTGMAAKYHIRFLFALDCCGLAITVLAPASALDPGRARQEKSMKFGFTGPK